MHISRYISRILASAVMTCFLIADAFQIGRIPIDEKLVQEAGKFKIECRKTIYDSNGNFKGCVPAPCKNSDCVVFTLLSADITVSSEGINVQ